MKAKKAEDKRVFSLKKNEAAVKAAETRRRNAEVKHLRKTKSKNSDSLVLGEIKDDMSPEMKAFMGSYKDWKDDGGVIPENSDEILEEILENEKSDSSSNSRAFLVSLPDYSDCPSCKRP